METNSLVDSPPRTLSEAPHNVTLPAIVEKAQTHVEENVTRIVITDKHLSAHHESPVEVHSLPERYAAVRRMRCADAQESLSRECDLSTIINTFQRREGDWAASREFERAAHARHATHHARANAHLRAHVQSLEAALSALRATHRTATDGLEARLASLCAQLEADRRRYAEAEARREGALQQLCANLCATQKELERAAAQAAQAAAHERARREAARREAAANGERRLWENVLRRREGLLLMEREALLAQCASLPRPVPASHLVSALAARVELALDGRRALLETSAFVKETLFEASAAALAGDALAARHASQSTELVALGARHEALAHILAECSRALATSQREAAEAAIAERALDDITMGYVLHQRDAEVRDKVAYWMEAVREAHHLLRVLLKRYEPFQRGDEVFVRHVIQFLAAAPDVNKANRISST